MKTIFCLSICILVGTLNLKGQYAIDAAGAYFKNGSYSASYSIGEVSTATIRGIQSSIVSTSGVIQPDPLTITGTKDPGITTIRIYPNPVSDELKLLTEKIDKIYYEIYSMQDVLLLQGMVNGLSVNLNSLTSGIYLINFSFNNSHQKQAFLISKL